MDKLKFCMIFLIVFIIPINANAGFGSKALRLVKEATTISFQYAQKKWGKEIITKGGEKVVKSNIDEVGLKYGTHVTKKIDNVFFKSDLSKAQIGDEILRFGHIYKKSGFAEDALVFEIKNKKAGKHLLGKFDYGNLKAAGLLESNSKSAVQAMWRLSDDIAIGGSKTKFKKALKNSNISVDDCIPCKKLLNKQDKYSKISFKKISKKPNTKSRWRPQPYNEEDIVFDATWGN